MLPIRDTIPSKKYPVVTLLLIALHVLFYLVAPLRALATFSFFYNLIMLFIFGDHVEDRLGHEKYFGFCLLCLVTASIAFNFIDIDSPLIVTSISGIVAGILGAYFIQYPGAKVISFIPVILGFPSFIEIPALVFLTFWFPVQLFLLVDSPTHFNWFVGLLPLLGFIVGIIYFKLLLKITTTWQLNSLNKTTLKRGSPRLQFIKPVIHPDEPDLYGMISITAIEGKTGAPKLIYIPPGLIKSFFKLKIPAGTRKGQVLKLIGLGNRMRRGSRGDLYLKVIVD